MTTTPQAAVPSAREIERKLRRRQRLKAMQVGVLIPTLLSFIYYAFIARPEYTSTTKFVIQGTEAATPDILSGLGIPAASPASNDAKVITEYVISGAMVRVLKARYGFEQAYGGFTFDPAGYVPRNAPGDVATSFWQKQVQAIADPATHIVTVSVSAFKPEDARQLARGVLAAAQDVVNMLNEKALTESLQAAGRDLEEKRVAYEQARNQFARLRAGRSLTLDAQTDQRVSSIGDIDGKLSQLRAEQAAAATTFRPDAPQMRAIQQQISALESLRGQAVSKAYEGAGPSEASSDFAGRVVQLDYEFAQRSYYESLDAYQKAMTSEQSQKRYLVAFIPPGLPEESNYWARFSNVIAIAIAASMLLGVGALTYSVVKDHMQ